MKYCKMCKRPASKVTIIHKPGEFSSLSAGYCLNCQEWILVGTLLLVLGATLTVAGLIKLHYATLLWGIGSLILSFALPGIVGYFHKKK